MEQRARIEDAKSGKTFSRSTKHVKAADRLRKRAERLREDTPS